MDVEGWMDIVDAGSMLDDSLLQHQTIDMDMGLGDAAGSIFDDARMHGSASSQVLILPKDACQADLTIGQRVTTTLSIPDAPTSPQLPFTSNPSVQMDHAAHGRNVIIKEESVFARAADISAYPLQHCPAQSGGVHMAAEYPSSHASLQRVHLDLPNLGSSSSFDMDVGFGTGPDPHASLPVGEMELGINIGMLSAPATATAAETRMSDVAHDVSIFTGSGSGSGSGQDAAPHAHAYVDPAVFGGTGTVHLDLMGALNFDVMTEDKRMSPSVHRANPNSAPDSTSASPAQAPAPAPASGSAPSAAGTPTVRRAAMGLSVSARSSPATKRKLPDEPDTPSVKRVKDCDDDDDDDGSDSLFDDDCSSMYGSAAGSAPGTPSAARRHVTFANGACTHAVNADDAVTGDDATDVNSEYGTRSAGSKSKSGVDDECDFCAVDGDVVLREDTDPNSTPRPRRQSAIKCLKSYRGMDGEDAEYEEPSEGGTRADPAGRPKPRGKSPAQAHASPKPETHKAHGATPPLGDCVSNESGIPICGVKNQRGDLCRRIGYCPFHGTNNALKYGIIVEQDQGVPYKRSWTRAEHDTFLKGLKMYGKGAWTQVASLIGTRNASQVQSHAQKFFARQKLREQGYKMKRSINDVVSLQN